jgi:hypothetical protein
VALTGFWSYVHADDEVEGGRIVQLGRDLAAEFELLTGDSIDLFLDRDSLEWGARWQERIETSLANVAFFVPVLTSRYFMSASCRLELRTFATGAERGGLRSLLLPVLYTDLPESASSDELVDLAQSFQWVDWRDLRFEDRSGSRYRRAVHGLAQRLAAANRAAEVPSQADVAAALADPVDSLGTLEVMSRYEEALPDLADTILELNGVIEHIGNLATGHTARLDQKPSGVSPFTWRLRVVRELSSSLEKPAAQLDQLGARFTISLHHMDAGVREIIRMAPDQPESRAEVCRFFSQIRNLSASAEAGLTPLERLLASTKTLDALSREIRPVTREMRQGLTLVLEGRAVMAEWVGLIDALDLDCGES